MKQKSLAVLLIAILFTAVYISPFTASASTIKLVTYADGDFYKAYTTASEDIADFLEEIGVTLEAMDTVNHSLSEALCQGMDIVVKRGFVVKFSIDGAAGEMKIARDTQVGPFALKLEEKYGKSLTYDESPAKYIEDGDVIRFTSRSEELSVYTRIVPFETEFVDAPALDKGVTEVAREGVVGECRITEIIKFSGGKEVSRKQESMEVTREPVKRIVSVGVKEPPAEAAEAFDGESGEFSYVTEYTMTATAYHASTCGKAPGSRSYGITASGQQARRGLVAVDPKVIPLGTKLYIEGYGYAEAADTGGAIKGMKIDLYMDTVAECMAFGRGKLKVYVLK